MDEVFLNALFSDETPLFRTPSEPNPGDRVTVRVRVAKGYAPLVTLLLENACRPMVCIKTDAFFETYEGTFTCGKCTYAFQITVGDATCFLCKDGIYAYLPELRHWFSYTPGFHVPEWSKGAVQYQIFVDRFRNGDPSNDVNDNEYYYVGGHARHLPWNAPVQDPDIFHFYGGDLQGVAEKLDYLQSLGVEVVYFNPLFVSPSSHKYDTQDYEHIDPHFGVIVDDRRHRMQDWEQHNGFAPEYIRRVTARRNLEETDRYFASLCQELHRRGMRIILDGVFNHCGSFHKWMDAEGIYVSLPAYQKGALQDKNSPYRGFFNFREDGSYEGWWDFYTLPKLNYEGSPKLTEKILSIAEKWAKPPYSIDGWRLDVAADLGHSPDYNHSFWRRFRQRLKAVNPELLILAEHYGDAAPWLQGDQWDSVMNYDAFMEPVTYFLTGMEKHSDRFVPELYQNGQAFFRAMAENMAKLQLPSLQCAMNELSNHDHSRFLTRTNRHAGRLKYQGSEAAGWDIQKAVLREAVTIQMTWPGAPTVYYGDEAGLVGWTDPDCRRTYPWGHEDLELLNLHRDLIAVHRAYPVFTYGSVKPLLAEHGLIAYARFDGKSTAVVVVNNRETPLDLHLSLISIGLVDGTLLKCLFRSNETGHSTLGDRKTVTKGEILLQLRPHSTRIYHTITGNR